MSAPVRDQLARDALDDFGLWNDDHTPDMRKAPGLQPEAFQTNANRAVTTTTKEGVLP